MRVDGAGERIREGLREDEPRILADGTGESVHVAIVDDGQLSLGELDEAFEVAVGLVVRLPHRDRVSLRSNENVEQERARLHAAVREKNTGRLFEILNLFEQPASRFRSVSRVDLG